MMVLRPAGKQTAPWSEVSAFYAHFLNFVTYKEFTWVDEYNPATAPNRKVRSMRFSRAIPTQPPPPPPSLTAEEQRWLQRPLFIM